MTTERMPAVFLPHGGGPWPFSNEPVFGSWDMWASMKAYMEGLGEISPQKPRAILMISAHWEERVPTLMTATKPPMLYDYSGFPPETYQLRWPAPGAPELAGQVQSLLQNAGFSTAENDKRGFDHGAFVPLKLAYPRAEVPTIQLSLKQGLDPRQHLRMGQALESLRDQGIFLVGSGMSYHNMNGFRRGGRSGLSPAEDSRAFDDWLETMAATEADGRQTMLAEWEKAPKARECHPREEHLLPLHVIAGAAGDDAATLPYRDKVMGVHISALQFG